MPSFRPAPATETALQEPPRWVWLAFPPVLIIVQYAIRYYDSATYSLLFDNEVGIVELATPAVLLVAIAAGGAALRYRGRFPGAWLKLWVPLVTFACFYFAGEELSWGQHLFAWATPEYWNTINDQGETNIHNISSWFDQKPRLLLELWVVGGGVIYPLSRRHREARVSDWGYWFWPTYVCFPAALLAILVRLPDRLEDWFGIGPLPLAIRYSEPQEYYFAVFLALYLISIWYRVRQLPVDH
ncbi:MAG: hypothetical protein ACREXY_04315 [Gammaproteobacteria bacterium]